MSEPEHNGDDGAEAERSAERDRLITSKYELNDDDPDDDASAKAERYAYIASEPERDDGDSADAGRAA